MSKADQKPMRAIARFRPHPLELPVLLGDTALASRIRNPQATWDCIDGNVLLIRQALAELKLRICQNLFFI